jgi:hypothetical protein
MALGLENNVAETAKAFQGNPQALQQRYTQKQDLFDLLALNMIKKNQDAAKRSLMLSQQKMPGTVLEQVEGAVTKNAAEKVKGVAGALATKNAQSQQKMRNMAGVSGAPAPNMAKMAEGGIIGFAEGKEVEGSSGILDDAWYMIKSLATGLKKKDLEAIQEKEGDSYLMSYAKKVAQTGNALLPANILKTIGLDKSKEELNALIKKASESPPAFGSEFLTKPRFTEAKTTGISQLQPKVDIGLQEALRKQNIKPDVKPPVVDEKKPITQVDDFSQDKSAGITATPAFDASKFAADGAFNTEVKGGIKDLINQDPQKAVDFQARTPAEQAFIDNMLKERMDMRAKMFDPDKLSSDRLSQMLLGAKGATAGEAFRTAGLAGINADRNVENLRRSEFDAVRKQFMEEANKSQKIKGDAFKDALGAKKQGVASGTSLTTSEKNAALEADKLVATISNNAVQSSLKKDLNDIQKQRNSILQSGNVITGNTKMVQLYENAEATTIKTLTAAATKAKGSNLGSDKAEKDKAIDAKLAADIKKLRETIKLKAAPFRDALKQATTNASAKTGGMPEVDKILGIK